MNEVIKPSCRHRYQVKVSVIVNCNIEHGKFSIFVAKQPDSHSIVESRVSHLKKRWKSQTQNM